MVAFEGSELCGRAEQYYHDFLGNEYDPAIPQVVAEHIRQCDRCQRRLNRLREVLCEAESGGSPVPLQQDAELTGVLQSHFELLGERLDCHRVKPLLASLLVPSVKIRIPTPVTVHIDQCPACAADLESLRALGLDAEQLARLSRLYADSAGSGFWNCLRTQSRLSMAGGDLPEALDAETRDHLCVCPRCRNRLYQQRQKRLVHEDSDSREQESVGCADVTLGDLFDSAVPYGRMGDAGDRAESRRCREHLRSCPHCLEKVQQLHRTVYGILERPDSGVVTMCTARSDEGTATEEDEPLYEGYPIDVQVVSREAPQVVVGAGKHRLAARWRPVFKPALMAAAIIPLAIIFFLGTRKASGLNPAQIDQMVREVPRIRVLVFGDDMAAPKQELWASKAERLLISETANRRTVFELALGRVSVVRRVEGDGKVVEADSVDLAVAKGHMDRLLGFSLNDSLKYATMERVEDLTGSDVPIEVYELQWQLSPVGGAAAPHRWKVYVDPVAKRVRKAQFFRWDSFEEAWVLDETRRFEYPDAGAVRRHADALLALE